MSAYEILEKMEELAGDMSFMSEKSRLIELINELEEVLAYEGVL